MLKDAPLRCCATPYIYGVAGGYKILPPYLIPVRCYPRLKGFLHTATAKYCAEHVTFAPSITRSFKSNLYNHEVFGFRAFVALLIMGDFLSK